MVDLNALLLQRANLDAQITAAQRETRTQSIEKIRALMAETGVTVADLGAAPRARKLTAKVPAKYRDSVGNTWSGRGFKPKWLEAQIAAGVPLSHFLIV